MLDNKVYTKTITRNYVIEICKLWVFKRYLHRLNTHNFLRILFPLVFTREQPPQLNCMERLERAVRKFENRPCVGDGDQIVSYRAFYELVKKVELFGRFAINFVVMATVR